MTATTDASTDPAGSRPAEPFRVLAFNGSLRKASSNRGLLLLALRLLEERAPGATKVELVDWIDQLPYYNEDLEADGLEVVGRWREAVGEADAIVIGMPEYNYGPPAVAKNAIDWATRPYGSAAFTGKVIALLTSGGKGGGTNVQAALGPIVTLLGNTLVVEPPVTIAMGFQRIQPDGATDDAEILGAVGAKMDGLLTALRNR